MSDVMIEAHDLTKRYGEKYALRNVSFEVNRGEVLGFLGPNGAGKTTTMKILTCFIAPTEGSAKVNGADVFDDPIAVRSAIGYLPESTPLYTEMLVLEYLEFMANMRGFTGGEARKRIKKVVEQTSLEDVIGSEIRSLSKGFRQRVGLAQALVHEPPILILDEPMSGLDPNQAAEIRELIRDIGKERTVILSTHDLGEVQVTCDRVLIVSGGRIVADDDPAELRARTGKARFVVTALGKESEARKVRDALSNINGVDKISQGKSDEDGELVFTVRPTAGKDLRAEIFRAAVASDFTLVGLEKKAEGLDKVFRDLTTGDSDGKADRRERAKKRKADKNKADKKKAAASKSEEE